MLAGEIAQWVAAGESVYLQSNFASLDSIVYQPADFLVSIQITNALIHPIEATGLGALERLLKPEDASLAPLRPTIEKPWMLLFVAPAPMEDSFTRQGIQGVGTDWGQKTAVCAWTRPA